MLIITKSAKVSKTDVSLGPRETYSLVIITNLDNHPRHHSWQSVFMLIICLSLTTNKLERQVWQEFLSPCPKRSNSCKNHAVSCNQKFGPQTLCLAFSGGGTMHMGVKVLMEVHLWGIQKDFTKDVTSEGGLSQNLREKGAF